MNWVTAFALGVPSNIFRFYPSFQNSVTLSHSQVQWFCMHFNRIPIDFHRQPTEPPTNFLHPIILINARPTSITATAGTRFCRDFFFKVMSSSHLDERILQPKIAFISSTRDSWIKLALIVQDS